MWLPTTWNGKFVMGGQGGYAGRVESQALGLGALEKGYAVAGTDTGHVGPGGSTDGSWALGQMERVVNYGHAAIHRVTATAKAVVQARYGRAADKSYFAGCSNGGRQGRGADVGPALPGRLRARSRRGRGSPAHGDPRMSSRTS